MLDRAGRGGFGRRRPTAAGEHRRCHGHSCHAGHPFHEPPLPETPFRHAGVVRMDRRNRFNLTCEANCVQANDPLVWVDCEMTGLDPARDVLVEIAVVVTDSELNLLDEGLDLLIATDPAKLSGMEEIVREMHTQSGLLDAL